MTTDVKIENKVAVLLKPPKLWKVVFHNDDQTPMEFVIGLLMAIFKHNEEKAKDITLEIHNSGYGVAGIYIHEIAEQKGLESTHISREKGYPLMITLEKDE